MNRIGTCPVGDSASVDHSLSLSPVRTSSSASLADWNCSRITLFERSAIVSTMAGGVVAGSKAFRKVLG